MKKFFAIFATVALLVTSAAITSSCQKDINNAKSLVGSSWVCNDKIDEMVYELTFNSVTEFTLVISKTQQYKGVYVLTGSTNGLTGATITVTIDGYSSDTRTGTFESESKLVLDNKIFIRDVKK